MKLPVRESFPVRPRKWPATLDEAVAKLDSALRRQRTRKTTRTRATTRTARTRREAD
jgi:ribosome-associated translation inhibitor RaiA